jgi:hypothetical protein
MSKPWYGWGAVSTCRTPRQFMRALPRNQLVDAATARDVSLYHWFQSRIGLAQDSGPVPLHVL